MNKINFSIILEDSGVSDTIQHKFEGLFPAWPTIVATVLAFVILLLVLTKFFWKPVKKMINDRKEYIQNNIDESKNLKIKSEKNFQESMNNLNTSLNEAKEIINNAKYDANQIKNDSILKTKKEIDKMWLDAKQEIIREKENLKKESKKEIIEVALAAATKIIDRNMDNEINRKIIKKFIKDNEIE